MRKIACWISYCSISKAASLAFFLVAFALIAGGAEAQMSQVIHDTQTEFSGGVFEQTGLEGTETAPEIMLDSYAEFSWSFEDYDISGWSSLTKDSAIAEENPAGQIHLRAERNTQNESYALFSRSITVPVKFVIEYLIYFDNLSPSGVPVPGDPILDQPTGACARLDIWNSTAGLRMDIFTDRMVSFWTRNAGIKDYPTVSYFDVTTEIGRWYTLRLEGDFTDPQLRVQVYRDNEWIGELKADTRNSTPGIRPMAYSRIVEDVAEVHIDYVKLGTAAKQYHTTGTYTSPVLDLGATSFGSLSWTDEVTEYPYPWGGWTKYEGNPVLDDGWGSGNLPENILTDIDDPLQQPLQYPHPTLGNKYWLVYSTCCGYDIRLAYSDDLLNWIPYEWNPILSPSTGEYYLFSPNLFKKGSTYYLVYDVAMNSPHGSAQRIAYATASSPLGPWTPGQVILDLGASGEWDEGRVSEPFVFKDGDTYYLFYMGDAISYGSREQIGLAMTTSALFPLGPESGGLWTKHGLILPHNPDPAAWDRGLTADPSVIKVGDIFYMLYTGSYANAAWKLGIAWATSPFGPWNRPLSPNVPLGPAGAWDDDKLVRGAIHYHDGTYYMPYSGTDGSRYRGGMAVADPYVPESLIAFETRTSSNGTDWEGWQPVADNGAIIQSIPSRYFQYRATLNLSSSGISPILTSVTINYQTTLTVNIDIKPGSYPNSINPKSRGKIPVAILSTSTPYFYAPAMVDPVSLTFGRTGEEESLAFCNRSSEDVNGDGDGDLMCHFYTQDTGFLPGDTEGILRGETLDGTPIEGRDSVRIVPSRMDMPGPGPASGLPMSPR